jgi:hypothetical protein
LEKNDYYLFVFHLLGRVLVLRLHQLRRQVTDSSESGPVRDLDVLQLGFLLDQPDELLALVDRRVQNRSLRFDTL